MLKIYECEECGKMIFVMNNKFETETICCGEPMKESKIHRTDMGMEKHVPVLSIKDNCAHIKVGEVIHPSEPNHYIKMIVLEFEDGFTVRRLCSRDKPDVCIPFEKGKKIKNVYSYCNIHGWFIHSCDKKCDDIKKE